uniref:NAD(P)-binding protein n=1 Tax=Paractinoplanes polyasparticus TaxID=2856853 RepID=UPI001C845B68|nr:NAD(P)-binding protein [Actinoplanes polyasparticus]
MRVETDYLVIGAGASGMAFADALVTHSDADVVIVDRRHRPGGHWNDAYPFVRLHAPSAYYGVNSMPLGNDTIDRDGPNAGLYELATGAAICDYYTRVLDERLIPSGRVRFLGMHDYRTNDTGVNRVVSRLTGATSDITVNRKVVEANYLQSDVPATHTPTFTADPGVHVVPINELANQREHSAGYTIIGAGKTAMDACIWLLRNGVDPGRLRWIRPRDAWLVDRASLQPLDLVSSIVDGASRDFRALAGATSVDDLFRRLEQDGRLLRLDPDVTPTMYHCATVSRQELTELRRIEDVVRLGRVQHIGSDRVTLDGGSIPHDPSHLYVDCSASGLRRPRPRPIFEPGRITLQQVRTCQPVFNAALVAYVEATRRDDPAKNALCPVNPYPDNALDWLRSMAVSVAAAAAWSAEPDLKYWLANSRLNFLRGASERADEPAMQEAAQRSREFAQLAMKRLRELIPVRL